GPTAGPGRGHLPGCGGRIDGPAPNTAGPHRPGRGSQALGPGRPVARARMRDSDAPVRRLPARTTPKATTGPLLQRGCVHRHGAVDDRFGDIHLLRATVRPLRHNLRNDRRGDRTDALAVVVVVHRAARCLGQRRTRTPEHGEASAMTTTPNPQANLICGTSRVNSRKPTP